MERHFVFALSDDVAFIPKSRELLEETRQKWNRTRTNYGAEMTDESTEYVIVGRQGQEEEEEVRTGGH